MTLYIKNAFIILGLSCAVSAVNAGNPERQGQAGAAQLTINGFSRSSGWGWAGGASVRGVEASFLNAAGLDKSKNKTEIIFSRTQWLVGSGIGINSFGFTQKLGDKGENGTLCLSVMQFGIKPIDITTENNPDGGIGTYRVNMTNLGLGYGKSFSRNISAGIMVRAVSEGIPDAKTQGISLDAGVQYATTVRPTANGLKKDDLKFGISVKNIGPDMRYNGDGLSVKATLQDGDFVKTLQVKPDKIKLPAFLNIAASYDIRLDQNKELYDHRLTVGFAFTNFAFSSNQTTLGLEYSYKKFLAVRAGFVYQENIFDKENRTSAFTGPCAGLSYDWVSSKGNVIALDYSYRATQPFDGCHTFGIRIGIGQED